MDIVKKLRDETPGKFSEWHLRNEAADEIEKLRTALGEIASGLSVRNPFDVATAAMQPKK